jgi:type II secretory pathway pseudopilin PulG
LVEALVGTAILTFISAAMFPALSALQRNSAVNRNDSCALIMLRNVTDQALTRGWSDPANPNGIIAPTVSGTSGAFDSSGGGWVEWDPYRSANATASSLPVTIYSDQMNRSRDVTGHLFRKVQCVTGTNSLLWVSFRLDYVYRAKSYSRQMCTVRASD